MKLVIQLATFTITINVFEAGVIMGMMEDAGELVKRPCAGVWKQLVEMKKKVEEADGVVKKLLPSGMLEIKDVDGNRIVRPPMSWEIEGN